MARPKKNNSGKQSAKNNRAAKKTSRNDSRTGAKSADNTMTEEEFNAKYPWVKAYQALADALKLAYDNLTPKEKKRVTIRKLSRE